MHQRLFAHDHTQNTTIFFSRFSAVPVDLSVLFFFFFSCAFQRIRVGHLVFLHLCDQSSVLMLVWCFCAVDCPRVAAVVLFEIPLPSGLVLRSFHLSPFLPCL